MLARMRPRNITSWNVFANSDELQYVDRTTAESDIPAEARYEMTALESIPVDEDACEAQIVMIVGTILETLSRDRLQALRLRLVVLNVRIVGARNTIEATVLGDQKINGDVGRRVRQQTEVEAVGLAALQYTIRQYGVCPRKDRIRARSKRRSTDFFLVFHHITPDLTATFASSSMALDPGYQHQESDDCQ
eukprot:234364_1